MLKKLAISTLGSIGIVALVLFLFPLSPRKTWVADANEAWKFYIALPDYSEALKASKDDICAIHPYHEKLMRIASVLNEAKEAGQTLGNDEVAFSQRQFREELSASVTFLAPA